MPPGNSLADLLIRLKAGDEEFARQMVERFAHRLIALARARMESRLRQKADPEDVVQSVYKSFFVRQAQGLLQLESWDGLWSLLTVITIRKCGQLGRRYRAGMRDIAQEILRSDSSESSNLQWEALARDPSPSELAMLEETIHNLLAKLDPREREMVTMSLQGYSLGEISQHVGRTTRTVQRVLKRIKVQLERQRD